jgi:rod shape-determining protein MreD
VLPLFVAAQAIQLVVRMLAGDIFPGMSIFVAPVVQALLWPVASIVLLVPQRRAPDPDENRPL